MTDRDNGRYGVIDLLLLSGAAALLLLTVDWLVRARLGLGLQQGETGRVLVTLAAAAVPAGVGCVPVALLLRRFWPAPAVAIAAPVAGLLLVDLYFSYATHPFFKLLGAAGFGGLVFLLLVALLTRAGPGWYRPAGWWRAAALLLAAAFALTLPFAADRTGQLLAAGSVVPAVVLALWGYRRAGRAAGVLAVLVVVAGALSAGLRIPVLQPANGFAAGKPAVLLVSIDTLRADHVGSYGYAAARTPNLDALAAQGVRFSQAVTANAYTGPSHASILTGLYPESHGALVNSMRLPAAVPTLADILREEGYLTAAFVSGFTTQDSACGLPSRFQASDDDIRPWRWLPDGAERIGLLNLVTRMARRFGDYRGEFGQQYRMGADTADEAINWLGRNGGRPFFMWTHFFDPHVPYRPPQEYRVTDNSPAVFDWYQMNVRERLDTVSTPGRVDAMIALYDAEIAYVDAQLGRLLEAARAAAPDGDLLVVVVADHGEAMGEHGHYWTRNMYDPTLMVPLIIALPPAISQGAAVVDAQVRTIDIVPTVLDLLQIDPGTAFDGTSLLGLMRAETQDSTGPALSSLYPTTTDDFQLQLHGLRTSDWKLIRKRAGWLGGPESPYREKSVELYDLRNDAGELNDLATQQQERAGSMTRQLEEKAGNQVVPELELTPGERERLRSLGYVH